MIIQPDTFFKDIATKYKETWHSTKEINKEKVNNIDIFNPNTWVPSNASEAHVIANNVYKNIDNFILKLSRFENVDSFKKDYSYRFYEKHIKNNKDLEDNFSIKVNSVSTESIGTISFIKELIACWKSFCLSENGFDLDYLHFFSDQIFFKKIKKYSEYNQENFIKEFCNGYVSGNEAFYFTVNAVVKATFSTNSTSAKLDF